MYKSPIEIMQTEMHVKMENGIMKAVRDVGVNVDATELLKVLAYDRDQYQKGFADGREAGHEWISVEDGLPDMDERCLLCMENRITKHRWVTIGYFYTNYDEYVTHWMPLPEPPEEE